jgi:S1-C subfamily serine protease
MNLNKILAATLVLSIGALTVTNLRKTRTTDQELAETTAKITNFAGNSGGTGVVLESGPTASYVLTNAHVCGVVKYGGLVTTDAKQASVTSYKLSEIHDLCLITTNVDLGINTEVATDAPSVYSAAIVSGHPALLPTIITRGMFSGKEIIDIFTGMRECTEQDHENGLGMICAFLGGFPVIRTYQSQVISATIQPGSSGSAVFNEKGQISGLVFAGSGALSYGHIVPLEYVNNFLDNELTTLKDQRPLDDSVRKVMQTPETKLKTTCKETSSLEYEIVKDFCKYVNKDAIYE